MEGISLAQEVATEARSRELKQEFQRIFGAEPVVYRAPGRVNLIGEHTDYNDGFVMPAAIDRYVYLAIVPRTDGTVRVHSSTLSDTAEFDLTDDKPFPKGKWSNYIRGVVQTLRASRFDVNGCDILISSDLPIGAGLSSSAALEVVVGFAILDQSGISVDRRGLAAICQRAEHDFAGVRCGIMDQFSSCNGEPGRALLLDCRSLDYQPIEIPPGVSLVVCNTMVKHQLASGEYNIRRRDCEKAVEIISASTPGITALRDVSIEALREIETEITETMFRRCRHVITENGRVAEGAKALQAGDLDAFGRLMYESHSSLREDYEVSCPELDSLVEIATRQTGVYGARMTGGGFGGCTINLVREDGATSFSQAVRKEYQGRTSLIPEIYVFKPVGGVEKIVEV